MWNILDLIFKKFYNFLYATPSPLKKQGENISIRFIIVTVIAIYFLRQIVFFYQMVHIESPCKTYMNFVAAEVVQ